MPYHAGLQRFSVKVLHRRAGKTTCDMNHLLKAAMDNEWEKRRLLKIRPSLSTSELRELIKPPGGRHYGHVMPTRVQAKQTVWDKLKYYASGIPGVKPNESELLLRLPTGNKIQLFGADDPDSLRGIGLSGVNFDEFSQQPHNIFSEVISKALGDHLGFANFSGTIKGKDHLYQMYQAVKNDPEWFSLWQDIDTSLKTEDGITIQLLEQAMADDRAQIKQGLMTQDEYDQEWYLSPEAAIKGAIYGKELMAARKEGRIRSVPYDPSLLVNTYWDVGDTMAVWFGQSPYGGEVRVIDYYESKGEGLPHYANILKDKGYVYGDHWAPPDIEQNEYALGGTTRLEVARNLGIPFNVCPKIGVEDGIHAARMLLPRCWFDATKTAPGLEALLHYRRSFNQRMNEFQDKPLHNWASHGADAYRYMAVSHDTPVQKKATKTAPPVPASPWG